MNDHDSELITRANELADTARSLAHATRAINHPYDSYLLLGCLTATQRSLGQVYDQLANWHSNVIDGVEYSGEDSCGAGCAPGVARAELGLRDAAQFAGIVEDALLQAHNANSVVRWFDETAIRKSPKC
ncbi:hypothetical protein [Cryobacterium sp. PH29-G1]|uniref:hypothetical protein n=1 Tax=Cryobacterium sp. PH29-G1 TaxID=3046211 RepID=UPI0024BB3368|nr:hypothetical protein [Cryobacterium sp. PH29-G1]MDJ0348921.1 hypothetical protein [Cryobacterium sp. PH29-G1]